MRLIFQLLPKLFVTLFFLLQVFYSSAQAPPKQWDQRFGGINYDGLTSLQQTKDGGYILGGYSNSNISGDKSEDSRGSYDYWIIKINKSGVKQWDKRFGGTSDDYLNCVIQTTDGGYMLGGYSWSGVGGDKSDFNRGWTDYWIIKTDSKGNKQWDKTLGGSEEDDLFSLQQTTDGGYILGGSSYSGISGDKTEESRGMTDYWIVKINKNGKKQWDKSYGGTDEEIFHSLQQTSDKGYLFGGVSSSGISGEKTQSSWGSGDYWIVKTDSVGNKQWDKRFGGNHTDNLYALQQTTDGGYILGGTSESDKSGDKTQKNHGYTDYWIVKTDSYGGKLWDKTFGASASDDLTSVEQTIDGGYILGGYSASPVDGDKTDVNVGREDYWIVKIDKNGAKQWDKTFGGNSDNYLTSLHQTTDSGYVLGGFSNSDISGDKTQKSRGDYDYWIVKLGCPPTAKITPNGSIDICKKGFVKLNAYVSDGVHYQWLKNNQEIVGATDSSYTATSEGNYSVVVSSSEQCKSTSNIVVVTSCHLLSDNTLKISPNPSKGNIIVNYESQRSEKAQLFISDKTGRIIFTKEEYLINGANTYRLNLSGSAAGLYNLQIVTKTEVKTIKFILEE